MIDTLPEFACDALTPFYGAAEVAAARDAAAELLHDYRLVRRAAKRAAEHKLHVCHRQVAATGGEIVKSPSGFPIQNPWLSAANQAQTQMLRLAQQFGLTPKSRRASATRR